MGVPGVSEWWAPGPAICNLCLDDDKAFAVGGITNLIFTRVDPLRSSSDDHPDAHDTKLAFMHEAFEKAFCTKLQNNGSANFANVQDCTFRVLNSPVFNANVADRQKSTEQG
jgi:hypothetical protein